MVPRVHHLHYQEVQYSRPKVHIWNVDETNVTNIPKEKKFMGELGKKLNQVVESERTEMSTVVGCTNAASEKMPPLIIHRGVQVPATWTLNAPQYYRVPSMKKGYINDAVFYFCGKNVLSTPEKDRP